MMLHCDNCDRPLGEYLYGPGGIEERALIGAKRSPVSIPDITCFECLNINPKRIVSQLAPEPAPNNTPTERRAGGWS